MLWQSTSTPFMIKLSKPNNRRFNMVQYTKQNGSTNGPSRSRATTDNNKSKGKSGSTSGAAKPKGSTNGPSRG
ncbi:hypothetical protein [Citrobacter phage vB_CfrS_K1M]